MKEYYMFNKPSGCLTARRDERSKTVMDYFPEEKRDILFPVGRLDKDTEGLLIITDDGPLFYDLMKPEKKVSKTYFFWAKGTLSEEKRREIEEGVPIYSDCDSLTAPSTLKILEKKTLGDIKEYLSYEDSKLSRKKGELEVFSGLLTITEGKKHQVKRMIKYAGCNVLYLKRIAIGQLSLDGSLSPGEYRPLTEDELILLKTKK